MIQNDLLCSIVGHERSKQAEMAYLCEPLSHLGISNFSYTKITKDRDYFRISNCLPFTDMIQKNDWINSPLGANGLLTEDTFNGERKTITILWNTDDNPLTQQRRSIDMWNGANVYVIHPDHFELYSFGGTLRDTGLPNIIVNNLEHLKKYFNYFKSRAGEIIDTSEKGKSVKIQFYETQDQKNQKIKQQLETFMTNILDTSSIFVGNQLVSLSPREVECLIHRQQGLSAKEMARLLGISHRTVETYFENIKAKSGLGNINQVLAICRDEGLL